MSKHIPTNLCLHQKTHRLEIAFENGETFTMPCEYLRVYSPSAAVRGHGPGQEVLQVDKEGVNIIAIEPVGNYAVKVYFDDGHNSGIYDWDLLYTLGKHHDELWQDYLRKLKEAGHSHSQLQD
jgi:DUF971 family protein